MAEANDSQLKDKENSDNTNSQSQNTDNNLEDKGIEAVINKALNSYEKLPMLEVIFEKFVRLLSTSLRNLTENNVEAKVASINSLRFNNFIDTIPLPSLVIIFKAVEWDNYGIFIANNSLIFSLVELLFGGKSLEEIKIEERPYTTIEQSIVKQIANIVFKDLSSSFAAICPINFKYERMETDPRFASISRPGDSVILIEINLKMETKKGKIQILLPYETLEPIKEQLLQVFIGEKFGTVDLEWQNNLLNKVKNMDLTLKAILKGKPTKLHDILNLKVGSTIMMQNNSDDDIDVVCKGKKLFAGKIGRLGNKVAISLNQSARDYKIDKEKNLC